MFCPRPSRNHRGEQFLAFLPAISPQALTKIGRVVRRWRLHRRIYSTFEELARAINPIVARWMAYYGRFYRSKLSALLGSPSSDCNEPDQAEVVPGLVGVEVAVPRPHRP